MTRTSYGKAILAGFRFLMSQHEDVFVIGQGLWSPWYVGSSMTDLEKEFGTDRVIDSPVSEAAVTGMALGASLCGYRPVVVHPRVDFMILASDQIINQAAKWTHMFGGKTQAPMTIRAIVNRGGGQGAQHSQALHACFAHIPGLKVVMPATPQDAQDLLVASVLSDDPVLYIDDRWLYEVKADISPAEAIDLSGLRPSVLREGSDCTLVGSSYSTNLCIEAAERLSSSSISCEVVDLRIVNPLEFDIVTKSVSKTGRLCVVDGGWGTCGLAGEVIAGVSERLNPGSFLVPPVRVTLPDAPAPASKPLEDIYYPDNEDIYAAVERMLSAGKEHSYKNP